MDVNETMQSLSTQFVESLPSVIGAILILVFGWFAAIVIRAIARRALHAIGTNQRIEASTESSIDIEGGVASVIYYVILALVAVAFFNALNLQQVSGSIQGLVDQILGFAPKLIGGGVLALIAWVLATVLRSIATHALAASSIDERLSGEEGMRPMSDSLGSVVYWLVILLFLPGILGALEMQGLLDPVQGMVDQILSILPNLLGAIVIGAIGWFVAKILSDLVANLLAAAGADRVGERAGLEGNTTLSKLVGLIVYVFVFAPALIAALNVLAIDAISVPATEMLSAFMAAIPNVFGAAVILAVAYFVSSFISELTTSLLGGAGFDRLPGHIGLESVVPADSSPSQLIGRLVVFFVMLFATVEAANKLGFAQISEIVAMLIEFGGHVILGLVIIAVGFWLSNLASDTVRRVSGDGSAGIAGVVRIAILGIVLAMGLRAMGLADDIVNLAFGLTLGSVAVAFALSFGLGGREAAGRQMEHWLSQLRGE